MIQPGFRTKVVIVVTTLLDPGTTTKEDLASLYRSRWSQEAGCPGHQDQPSNGHSRARRPSLFAEIWTHILAHDLIRTIMAQAASQHGIQPREIGFKGTVQTLEAFQPLDQLPRPPRKTFRQELYLHLLRAVAAHRVPTTAPTASNRA